MAYSSHVKLPLRKVRTVIRTRNALLIYFFGFLLVLFFRTGTNLLLMILVTLSFPEAKVKIWQKFQISLCKKLNNKYFNYYVKVQVERFYLNDSTLGFYPRIQKLQPLYGTALFTLGIKELRGRSFDFWGGYGWFQKKISFRLISRGKKILARKYLAKKILRWQNICHGV